MKPPFEWDPYSDQPKLILDKRYKRRMRAQYWSDYLKMAATASVALAAATAHMALSQKHLRKSELRDLLGMGVNLDKGPAQFDLVEELGIRHVLIRVPLWDIENLHNYEHFAREFQNRGKTVLTNILQDREHIEDTRLLSEDLHRIFDSLATISQQYQIGNAINRVKWGFFAVQEYLQFYKTAQEIRDQHFSGIELLGPAVIDFECHFTSRALFNNYDLQFDRLSSLLYVDRMRAPDNKQFGLLDTDRKMRLLGSLAQLSPKVRHKGFYITEVNWPLKGTAPWAPTSEKECVNEEDYSTFIQRYLNIAALSGCVDRVYWHQLIAPGYGLIDNRNNTYRKTPAFIALQKILA